jgi:hypothetical protein
MDEDGEQAVPAVAPPELQIGGLGISYSSSVPAKPQADDRGSRPSSRHSKKVSFSRAEPEVLGSTEPYSTGSRPPLKRQDSWSGLFLISAAPIVTQRTPERKPSLPIYRDKQVAPSPILKRKSSADTFTSEHSSFQFQSDMARIRNVEKEAAMVAQQKPRHWRMRSVSQWVREDELSAHGKDITDAGIPMSFASNSVGVACA